MKNRGPQALRRVYILIAVMAVWGTVIGIRLYFLHVVQSADLRQRADRQQQRGFEVSPLRGIIYDRNNKELAISIKVDSVFAVPDEIKDPVRTAKVLSGLTGIPRSELIQRFDTDKSFTWIKRKISAAEANAIERAKLSGIHFLKEDQRFYPQGELAAHVLGNVNMDDEGGSGLEYKYNDSVRGEPGRVVVMTDARRRSYSRIEQPPTAGGNLVTTIDQNIQHFVEKEIREAFAQTRALGISAIVMDPRNGEILAMASYPNFNPNEYGKSDSSARINRAVNQVYEPGSTFKVLTVGAALEERLTRPDELIDCQNGWILIAGHRIHDSKPHGVMTVSEVIQQSSDVGAIKLGMRLGEDRFYSYVRRLGFGRATGVDLPGEERGLTKPTDRWSGLTLASMSMGHEIGVTPLQILAMMSAVANGGILYRPFVVKRIEDPEKGILETDPHGERVLSAETTVKLRPMLEDVLSAQGTAIRGRLEGYTAAGKTGTAQKIDNGRYSHTKYWASFAGFTPSTNPALAIIVVVDEAVGLHQGGQVAAPVFKRIAEQSLHYMSVPSDIPQYSPQYTFRDEKKKTEPVRQPVAPFIVPGDDDAQPASPAGRPQWRVLDAAYETSATSTPDDGFGSVAIPDFYGKSLRQVTEQCLKLGLRLRSTGSGAAAQQFPAPGATLRPGGHVQVRFTTQR